MELLFRLAVALSLVQLLVCIADRSTELVSDRSAERVSELSPHTNGTVQQRSAMRDCSDLPPGTASGVYMIMMDLQTPAPVFCDMDDGEGWTVFQRRADITPRQDFYQDWQTYKWGLGGFGGEFWWGLHYLWQLTSQPERQYELRVDLWDWEGETRYATYQKFTIAAEADGYRLDLSDYVGNAGDGLDYHNGMQFSTLDRDNDNKSTSCATQCKGAWWYNACTSSNLNGLYSPGSGDYYIITWYPWKGHNYSLEATTMKGEAALGIVSENIDSDNIIVLEAAKKTQHSLDGADDGLFVCTCRRKKKRKIAVPDEGVPFLSPD